MNLLRIALVQAAPCLTESDALEKGLAYCRRAAEAGADIVLFPEMWNIGYAFPENEAGLEAWKARALSAESPFVGEFRALAAELRIAIGLTFLERNDPLPLNSILVIDSGGRSCKPGPTKT